MPGEVEGAQGIPGVVVGIGVLGADVAPSAPTASGTNPKGGRRGGRRGGPKGSNG